MSRTEDITCLVFAGSKLFKSEDFSMEAFPKRRGLVLKDFGFADTVVLKKVFSSLSVVFREFQVLIVDLLSSSSVLLVLYKNSLFFKIAVRWCFSILIRNILQILRFGSSVRYFRLSPTFGFHGGLQRTLWPNNLPSSVHSTFEDLQAG